VNQLQGCENWVQLVAMKDQVALSFFTTTEKCRYTLLFSSSYTDLFPREGGM